MRPLLILNERDIHHPNAGGAEVNLFEVAQRLARRGYRPTLLCESFPGGRQEETIEGIRVRRFGRRASYYRQVPAAVRRNLAADTVIIEHLCKVPFLSPIYARRPVVAVTHHLFGRTSFWQASFPVAAAVFAAEWLIPPVYRNCAFIAVSPSTRDDLVRRGIDARRVRVIPNGVDSLHYTPAARAPSGPPTLLAFGRIEPYKRFDLILRAFSLVLRQVPECRLVLVGSGTALAAVRAEIRRLGLERNVRSTGPVDETVKIDLLQRSLLALNSSEKEGWGLTVLEAAACALPTVASDVPGLRDAVIDGRTGVLVRHGDVQALADATVALLRDDARRRELGRGARAWAENFSWDAVAEATAHCIEEACGAAPAAVPHTWFGEPLAVGSEAPSAVRDG